MILRPLRLSGDEFGVFHHIPESDRARARLFVVRWLPMGTAGMTFGRNIFLRSGHEQDSALIAHELVHVAQWRELGPVLFLWRYLTPYFLFRLNGLTHWEAYRRIPLEVEATRAARRLLIPPHPTTSGPGLAGRPAGE